MRFRDIVYAYLKSCTDITALVNEKVYPANKIPQEVKAPYVVSQQSGRQRGYTHQGYDGTDTYTFTISALAKTDDECGLIADAILEVIEAWPGENINIGYSQLVNETDATWEVNLEVYSIDLTFEIFYQQN